MPGLFFDHLGESGRIKDSVDFSPVRASRGLPLLGPHSMKLTHRKSHTRAAFVMSAFGDAMGGSVHHDDADSIMSRYGIYGVCSPPRPGLVTSGTQLMLFTADALIRNRIGNNSRTGALVELRHAYLRWFKTQLLLEPNRGAPRPFEEHSDPGWLAQMPQLCQVRLSDSCITSSLRQGANGTLESPVNGSANGVALTRVTPIGLVYGPHEAFWLAARAAAFTNGSPIACYASAALAHLLANLSAGMNMSLAIESLTATFKGRPEAYSVVRWVREAAQCAQSSPGQLGVLENLASDDSADHTLATAVYCFLSEPALTRATWSMALAANHSGPSALTCSVTGALLGAWHGADVINRRWLARMELIRAIVQVADDLSDAFDGKFNENDESAYPSINEGTH
jgi:ADP-ribosylglycohydrolase